MSKLEKTTWFWVGGAFVAGAVITRWQLQRLFTEQPQYRVEGHVGDLEIRRYASRWVAETRVSGVDWDAALSEGFRRLARYIFGENRRSALLPGGTPASIAERLENMTAPVQERTVEAEKIPMIAPVNASHNPDLSYTISFNMPSGRSFASLPVPEDERIMLTSKPPQHVAVLRYRGRYNAAKVAAKFSELRERVREAGLIARGEPEFAGYDPPSTLPLLRRNEVWVELAPARA
jgi:hypothetical protein